MINVVLSKTNSMLKALVSCKRTHIQHFLFVVSRFEQIKLLLFGNIRTTPYDDKDCNLTLVL